MVMSSSAITGRSASNWWGLSWLPAITTTLAPVSRRSSSGAQRDGLRVGARSRRLVDVAGDDDHVDGLLTRDPGDLGEHLRVLVEARLALQPLADVPVGGVEQLHRVRQSGRPLERIGRRGRIAAQARQTRRCSSGRVAQAGNGNSTTSGTGISGWLTNIVPGLAIVARWRCAAERKPYSGRAASAGSSRPDDPDRRVRDDAALDLARRLLRADQDDAERCGPARPRRAGSP